MFKKILVATDLSEASKAVINCLKDFKTIGVEEVILFYACGIRHLDALAEGIKQKVLPDLEKLQKIIQDQGLNCSLEIAPGLPSEEIKVVTNKKKISLIVISSHGESAFTHHLFRFGGTTSEIIHSHETPLLLVKTRITEVDGKPVIDTTCQSLKTKILFATDFSDISLRAFNYVVRLVEDGCKDVTIMHVQDKIKIGKHLMHKLEEFNHLDNERLEMRKKLLLEKGAEHVETILRYGIPAEEVLAESRNNYSLIVLGSQGRGFFKEIFIGSVSHAIARLAPIPVLLIPADRSFSSKLT